MNEDEWRVGRCYRCGENEVRAPYGWGLCSECKKKKKVDGEKTVAAIEQLKKQSQAAARREEVYWFAQKNLLMSSWRVIPIVCFTVLLGIINLSVSEISVVFPVIFLFFGALVFQDAMKLYANEYYWYARVNFIITAGFALLALTTAADLL